jgi:chromosome segregation ATPase
MRRGKEFVGQASPSGASIPPVAPKNPGDHAGTSSLAASGGDRRGRQINELRTQFEQQSAEITRLKANRAQFESDRNTKAADAEELSREDIELTQQLSTAKGKSQDIQQKLSSLIGRGATNACRVASLEGRVSELSDFLHERDQQVARDQNLLDHDSDIRELMGERDLYIADV